MCVFFVCVPINLIVDKIIQFLTLSMVLDWKLNKWLKIHNIFIYTNIKNVKKKILRNGNFTFEIASFFK